MQLDHDAPKAVDLTRIGAYRESHLGRLFLRAHRDFSERAMHKIQRRGHPGLGPAHMGLLPHIAIEGTRVSTLAERSQISKQAAGQLVQDLEGKGYVAREVDPDDRRAVRVRFTAAGQQFLRDAWEVKQEIEAEYAVLLGEPGIAQLQALLGRLLGDAGSDGLDANPGSGHG
jgi:DNA-binding MarR family transcriptional regulator